MPLRSTAMLRRLFSSLSLVLIGLSVSLSAQKVPAPSNGTEALGVYEIIRSGDHLFARIDHDILYSDATARDWNPLHLPVAKEATLFDIETDGTRLWVATTEGVYGRIGVGGTWELLSDNKIHALLATPDGSLLGSNAGTSGLMRSTDNGTNWTDVKDAEVKQMVMGSDGVLWVNTSEGVSLSGDDGQTWTRFAPSSASVEISHLYPAGDGEIYAFGPNLSMISDRGNDTWRVTGTTPAYQEIVMVGEFWLPGVLTLVVTLEDSPNHTGTYLSADSGRAWVSTGLFYTDRDQSVHTLLPLTDTTVLYGTTYAFSQNSSLSFNRFAQLIVADRRPGIVAADAEFSGSLATSQISDIFVHRDSSIVITRFVHGRINHERGRWVYRSENQGDEWKITLDAGGNAVMSETSTGTLLSVGGGIVRSSDGGVSWAYIETVDEDWRPVGKVLEFSNGHLIATSEKDVMNRVLYKSSDDGVSWYRLSERTAAGTHGIAAAAPDGTGYLTEFKNIVVTTDTGKSWSTVEVATRSRDWLIGLVIDPNGTPIAVSRLGSVYRSDNRGKEWTEVTIVEGDSLSSLFTSSEGTLYAGSVAGTIWRSLDNGTTWRPCTTVPDSDAGAILSMAIGTERTMYIGTENRGLWKVDMDQIGSVEETIRQAVRLELR